MRIFRPKVRAYSTASLFSFQAPFSVSSSASLNQRQGGVVLISVLLIVAILVALSTQLLSNHNLVVSQHQNSFEQNQALQYAHGAEELTRQLLFDDFSISGIGVDNLQETWAQPVLPFKLDEVGYIEVQVRDLNGCFNVNSLMGVAGADNLAGLKRLFQNLQVNPGLADQIKDWVDIDQSVTGFGAEDNVYLGLTPPYRTANQSMRHISALFLLHDIEAEDIRIISSHLCVLPNSANVVNVNTANASLLSSLDGEISNQIALGLAESERSFVNVEEFIDANPAFTIVAPQLSVTSEYFEMQAKVQVGESTVSIASLFFRNTDTGKVILLQRDFAKIFQSNVVVDIDADS